jgi:hypothetical protein
LDQAARMLRSPLASLFWVPAKKLKTHRWIRQRQQNGNKTENAMTLDSKGNSRGPLYIEVKLTEVFATF